MKNLSYYKTAEMLNVLVLMVLLNKMVFPPTAVQLTVYVNHRKSKDGEEISSWRNVAISSPTRLLLSCLPIKILTSSVHHAFLKRNDASEEKKVHQRCEITP